MQTAIGWKSFARECLRAVAAHTSRSCPSDGKLLQQILGSGSDANETGYFYSGLTLSMGIRSALRAVGKQVGDFDRLLDFGCGSARVLRWFQDVLPQTELHGCDVNREAIDWCNANAPFAKFILNEKDPPLPYPSGYFDFIYGVSCFDAFRRGTSICLAC